MKSQNIGMVVVVAVMWTGLGASVALGAAAGDRGRIDAAVGGLGKFEAGQARPPIAEVEAMVRQTYGDAELRGYLEEKLAGLLESGASADAKLAACQQLWVMGPTARSLPALNKMLADEVLSHAAVYAIGRGASDPSNEVLREALASAKGKAAGNILNCLGVRRDKGAVKAIVARCGDADAAVAEAAVSALGRIASEEAAAALKEMRGRGSETPWAVRLASLNCAQVMATDGATASAAAIFSEMMKDPHVAIRRGALFGRVALADKDAVGVATAAVSSNEPMMANTAIAAMRLSGSREIAAELAKAMPKLAPETQAVLIDALAARPTPEGTAAIERAAASEHVAVRIASARALGRLGTPAIAPLLLRMAASNEADERKAALASLVQLPGEDVSALVARNLADAPPALRALLIKTLADRRAAGAVATLLPYAKDADAAVARAALDAIGALGGADQLDNVLKLVPALMEESTRRAAEQAAVAIALRLPDEATRADAAIAAYGAATTPEAKAAYIRVMGGIAAPRALEVLKEAAKETDQSLRDAALRALSAWPDTAPSAFLLNYARLTDANNLRRALAVRGALRQMSDAAGRLGATTPPAALVEGFVKGEQLVRGPEEKRLLLSGLANLRHAESARLVQNYLEDAEVQQEALLAGLQIAENLKESQRDAALGLAKKVQATAKDAPTKQKATRLINLMGAK